MLCLGIETSCDETALALVSEEGLLAHSLATQADVHALFGGVVPEIASREHLRILPGLFDDVMEQGGVAPRDIDVVAVTRGPGLLGSLLVGLSFAKGLCLSCGVGLLGVNHLWAHLLAPGIEQEMEFPALGLLVSGGHTHTYLMKSFHDFNLLGRTLDDAAGEAFDKVAKLLNFSYPGGRFIDELGRGVEPDRKMFPRAYIDNDNLDFSFSGLKTAVARHVQANRDLVPEKMVATDDIGLLKRDRRLAEVCASFNWSVADTLRVKVERALDRVPEVRSLVVAGGVAANSFLRAAMADLALQRGLRLTLPGTEFCTDNGAMIAHAGYLLAKAGFRHDLGLEAIPRGRTVPLDWTVG